MGGTYKGSIKRKMIKPYYNKLINNIITEKKEIDKLLSGNYKQIEISKDVLLEIENIANGVYSPLTGFPNINNINSIFENWKLKNGVIFPIPPLCHINKETYNSISEGEIVILNYKNNPVAVIELEEKSKFDKSKYIKNIFRTFDPSHPGVSFIKAANEYIITGSIHKLGPNNYFYDKDALTPLQVRDVINKKKWQKVIAFSTTNVPHRAHEHLQRIALNVGGGLFIHALNQIGRKPKFTKMQIKESYSALIKNYYPVDKVLFSFLPTIPRSAGPRSSFLQAIIRQNFGCTSQIFGRDHEGFKNTYGEYESQMIFEKFPVLKLEPLSLKGPFYCEKCMLVVTEDTCNHDSKYKKEISGSLIRKLIEEGKYVSEYLMREEVCRIISTKANTLKTLYPILKKAKIKRPFIFTIHDWEKNREKITSLIKQQFNSEMLIIRSSALNEDTSTDSMAGAYTSVLDVNSLKKAETEKAIDTVINSYKNKGEINKDNQILIQKSVKSIKMSGVIFTRAPVSGAPYYIINFDDISGSTDSVTKGVENKAIKIFHFAKINKLPLKWQKLLKAVKELEDLVPNRPLDIEFAINEKDEIVFFQVRLITSIRTKSHKKSDLKINSILNNIKNKYRHIIMDKHRIFSDMSFWNPAEIIGNFPKPLDYSLYNYLLQNTI